MRRWIVAAGIAVLASAAAFGQATSGFEVEVAGVRMTRAGYNDDFSMQVMNSPEGTTVALLVKGAGIVGFDETASKITALKDDKGTDLTPGEGWHKLKFGDNPKVSSDNKALLVELVAAHAPAKGARTVHLEASLGVVTANGTEDKEAPLSLEKGATVALGPEPLVLDKVEDVSWNKDYPVMLTWNTKKAPVWLAAISAKDADGKEVKCLHYTVGWESFGDAPKTYMVSAQMAKKPAKGKLVLSLRKDVKTVPVAVTLDIGIGG